MSVDGVAPVIGETGIEAGATSPLRERSEPRTLEVESLSLGTLLGRERLRFWLAFSFILWPLGPVAIPIYVLVNRVRVHRARRGRPAPLGRLFVLWILHPFYLISTAWKRRNYGLLLSVALLLPMYMATLWGLYVLVWGDWENVTFMHVLLQSPLEHPPMGTDGQGRAIWIQVAAGARHSYVTSLLAVLVALGLGLAGGRATNAPRLEGPVMLGVQLLETIPLLFILMVVFALFSDWSAGISSLGMKGLLRVSVLAVALGVGFAPAMVRLIRDKIRTFKSEEFVSATKAHGIAQGDILWRHIIWKNAATDLIILAAQIWGFAMLMEVSLSYVFSIGAPKLGGEPYASWAWLLLTPESKNALIGNVPRVFDHWWLWFFPAFFISSAIMGFGLLGDGLKKWHRRREQSNVEETPSRFEETLGAHFAAP